jgi:hypothetical protein
VVSDPSSWSLGSIVLEAGKAEHHGREHTMEKRNQEERRGAPFKEFL